MRAWRDAQQEVLGRALGVETAVIEEVREREGMPGFVVRVRPRDKHASRCPVCLARCGGGGWREVA